MTSPEALLALRELPRTNPTLYDEISANCSIGEESNEIEEDAFSPENEIDGSDETDIPTEVVRSLVVSDGRNIGDGYGLDNDGTIVRVGAAEGTSLIEDKGMVELGRGHRVKTGSKRYKGEWEGH
jgi:hypothetical protein